MAWYNPLSWLAKPMPVPTPVPKVLEVPSLHDESTVELEPIDVEEPIAPELVASSDVKLNPAVDAAISLILLLDRELGEKPIPDDLREISDVIHSKLPLSIRDNDAPTTRAEFALTIQRGALYLRAMKDWYDAP